jgi:hypothetical protein
VTGELLSGKDLDKFHCGLLKILLSVWVTIDKVWIGNFISLILTERELKSVPGHAGIVRNEAADSWQERDLNIRS